MWGWCFLFFALRNYFTDPSINTNYLSGLQMVMTDTSDKAGKKNFAIIFLDSSLKKLNCEVLTREYSDSNFFRLILSYL